MLAHLCTSDHDPLCCRIRHRGNSHNLGCRFAQSQGLFASITQGREARCTCTLKPAYEEKGIDTPAHLTCQADNCSREMKNQYTLLFGVLLVHTDTVRSFTCSFLRKGHTHEDIGFGVE